MRSARVTHSLSLRLALVISGVLLIVMLTIGLWLDRQLTQSLRSEEERQALTHASTLLTSLRTLMLNGQGMLAREWLDGMQGAQGIVDIEVLRQDGREAFTDLSTVQAVNRYLGGPRFERSPVSPHHAQVLNTPAFAQAVRGNTTIDWAGRGMMTVFMPISAETACLTCHGYDEDSIRGVLKLSLSTESSELRTAATRRQLWLFFAGVVTLIGLTMWLAMRMSVVGPIARLRDALIRVGEGDRGAHLPVTGSDELGEVAAVFNRMQDLIRTSEVRTRAVMDNVVDAIITIDAGGIIESANPAVTKIFGYAPEELLGRNVNILVPHEERQHQDKALADYLQTGSSWVLGVGREVVALRKDGSRFSADLAVSEMSLGGARYFIGIVRDITERKQQRQALEYLALHDPLTNLPNRAQLLDKVGEAINLTRREGGCVALLLMDLNHFKEINDTLGHHNGDFILQQVGSRLHQVLKPGEVVARLGGDEFGVMVPHANAELAQQAAAALLRVLEQPFTLEEQSFHIGASVGIAYSPAHGDEPLTLLRRADVAMYHAKRTRVECSTYDPALDQHSLRNLALMGELRTAIEQRQLVLHYQPKVNVQTGRVTGVEALVRWHHPEHGLMSPDEFISLAEQSGLIRPITMWVLEEALRQGREWLGDGVDLDMAVNLSASSLQDAHFLEQIQGLLIVSPRSASRLRLEITETAIMADAQRALEILKRLSTMGVRLAVDDFGTGYSSLAYLKRLPVDELKIDKSFVTDMTREENDAVIVRSTIDLAHNMGLKVVAEGVQDAATLKMLEEWGCDVAQGFFFSPPLSAGELMAWLQDAGVKRSRRH